MPDAVYQCQEHLHNLCRFSQSMMQRIEASGNTPRVLLEAAYGSLSGECIQCGFRISGEELLSLSSSELDDKASPRLKRLRLGYCARNGCDAVYYRISCTGHPDINWLSFFQKQDLPTINFSRSETSRLKPIHFSLGKFLDWRILITAVTLLVLILLRQYYRGGSIPFLREPENFKVDHNEVQP